MRKVKDAKDLSSNELIYFKSHAKATYMSDGRSVEDAINEIPEGGGGGGSVGPQGPAGEDGKDGVSITSVVQTTTSTADGGSNVVTVTLSDGKTSTFTVKNGSKGSQGEKGEQGEQGIQGIQGEKGDKGDKGDTGSNGEDGATFTPSVDADGNLSWTNDKGLSNPPTVNIKGPKGDSGEGGGGSSYAGNYPIVEGLLERITYIEPNTYYVFESAGVGGGGGSITFDINLVIPSNLGIVNEYVFELRYIEDAISLPAYVTWANGDVPSLTVGKSYVISIVNNLAVYAEF